MLRIEPVDGWPFRARVLDGSLVVKHTYGFTEEQALSRAQQWAADYVTEEEMIEFLTVEEEPVAALEYGDDAA